MAAQDPKSRLLAKARKIQRELDRYGQFGYVTSLESYEADDRKLARAIDGLYDSARKEGLGEDSELQATRLGLRASYTAAREFAVGARRQSREAAARARAGGRTKAPAGMQGYLDELSIGEARRRAQRGKG